jgi:hypothetical protein
MIYQLVKRDFSWKLGLGLGVLCAAGCLFSYWAVACLWLLLVLGRRLHRCSPYQAPLPIRGRDLFFARLLSDLMLIWLPFLAAVAAILARGEFPGSGIAFSAFTVEAVLTFAVVAVRAVRVEEFSAPGWWLNVVAAIAAVAILLCFEKAATPWILLLCTVGSAALFLKTWAAVPESFQIAPAEPTSRRVQKGASLLPSVVWAPALRTLYPLVSLFRVILLAVYSLAGNSGLGAWLVVPAFGQDLRPLQWLLSLPISRQRLFLAALLPPLGSFLAARLFYLCYSHQPVRIVFITLMTLAALALLSVLAGEIPYVACLHRIPLAYRVIPSALYLLFFFCWGLGLGCHSFRGLEAMPLRGLEAMPFVIPMEKLLPGNLPMLIVTAVAVVGALYWLAYKCFCQIEPKRRSQYQRAP